MAHYALCGDTIPRAERKARGYHDIGRTVSIEHSGHTYTTDQEAYVAGGWGWVRVWPIEELLARAAYQPAQAQRIRKLNPYGKPEAATCAGFKPWP